MTREDVIKELASAIEDSQTLYPWNRAEHVLSALDSLGIALVPVKPSQAMLDAGHGAVDFEEGGNSASIGARTAYACYKAMLSNSPLRKTEGA